MKEQEVKSKMVRLLAKSVSSVVLQIILTNDTKMATKYISEKFVINATRKLSQGKIDKRSKEIDIVLKIGRPNFAEREFIKNCKMAGEPFPVKNIQIKKINKR